MRYPLPKNSGYIQDSIDPRDVYLDEIVGGEEKPIPKSYRTEGLVFEPQGAYPFCASMATTKMVEYAVAKQTSIHHDLSQPHLFFNCGGSTVGSTFRGNLNLALTSGCIHAAKCPMPKDIWDTDNFQEERRKAIATPFIEPQKILGYARVNPKVLELQRAIVDYGLVLVGVAASGGYWRDEAKRPAGKPDNHACLLCGWDEDGSWWVFDSLQPFKGFTGYHRLHRDYEFQSAYVVTELPADWKEKRDEARTEPFAHCLNHYGKPRNFEREQEVAAEMLREFKRFNNQSVLEAAGRFWTVVCNMVVYGGYNISYAKWGMWHPGDVINFIYAWRRTGKFIFDPNKERKDL